MQSQSGGSPLAQLLYANTAHRICNTIANHQETIPDDLLAAWYGHPYLRRAVILPDADDPRRFVVHLAPSWNDLKSAAEAALDQQDGLVGAFNLAPYLPDAASLPDWTMDSADRGVRYVCEFERIEEAHQAGRLHGDAVVSLLPS